MKWFALTFLLCGTLQAEPLIVGFERFHGEKATAEGGAILYSELGCANCHGDSPIDLPRSGPVLDGIGKRVQPEWVSRYLADPQAIKSGTAMPALFGEGEEDRINAVVAYLSRTPEPKLEKTRSARHTNAELGSELYHKKGCVACHEATPDFHPAGGSPDWSEIDYPVKGFPNLQEKYSVISLSKTLRHLHVYRPDGRMPDFGLNDQESVDIAAHLLDYQPSDPRDAELVGQPPRADAEEIARGKAIVAEMNCAACHSIEDLKPAAMIDIPKGSVDCSVADYALSQPQEDSLVLYFEQANDLAKLIPPDRMATALNCYACHDRNGIGGPDGVRNEYFSGDEGIGDAGRLAPPLTGIGQKLQEKWMRGVFEGKNRVRPYVDTQMPRYQSHAAALTKAFQNDREVQEPLAEAHDLEAGQKLLGIEGGVNCITCHQWEDKQSLGIQALDIASLDQRLRPEWFRQYLLNPAEYRPGTLMPPLWPGGHATVTDVLDGDTEAQISSIWAFIAEGEGLPGGYPANTAGAFELKPTDRPIIQRTFLNEAGSQAILVGFPEGVHIAYDALLGRPAAAWKGKFFDAYSTWFVRAAPFESPLGDSVVLWPETPFMAEARYRGYRLDKNGVPSFLYRLGKEEISDRYQPTEDGKLKRSISGTPSDFTVIHPEGVEVEDLGNQTFIYSWK